MQFISSDQCGVSLGPGKLSKTKYLRKQFRKKLRDELILQGAFLPLGNEFSLSITVEENGEDEYCMDLDNLLAGVMSSLDDRPFMPGPRLVRDDRLVKSVNINFR